MHNNCELQQIRSMRGRAHSKTTRTQTNKINARARALTQNANSNKHDRCASARFNKTANPNKQDQCAGARMQRNRELKHTRIHNNRELKHIRSMRGRAHSKKTRTQTNTIDARPRAFKQLANSIKQGQCAGARIQRNRQLKQRRSMRERAL